MNKVEKFLFQLFIFLIPTNLAYHFITKSSYVNGFLVDYLIPKIYLSDIPILLLLVIWFFKSLRKKSPKTIKVSSKSFFLISLFLILLIRGLLSDNPTASIYYWLTISKLILFYLWIKSKLNNGLSLKGLLKIIRTPLIIALLFQSFVGLYQVAFQRSIAQYWFFGETTLNLSSQIDKIHLKNLYLPLDNSLVIPAYGTTPHNNVLAGFLSLGIILLYLSTRGKGKYKVYQSINLYITITLSLLTLLLTFSGSAWISLMLGISLIGLSQTTSKHRFRLIFRLFYPLIYILITIITIIPLKYNNISILRRQQLNHISLSIILENPLTGVGLNNFTQKMSEFGSISSTTKFLQPSHNILLLWLAETGLLGFTLLILLIKAVKPPKSIRLQHIPILMILIIGLLDHYPLTLQAGQLIFLLSIITAQSANKT